MNNKDQQIENSVLIGETLLILEESMSVTLTAVGDSMRPFIAGGRDKVVLTKAARPNSESAPSDECGCSSLPEGSHPVEIRKGDIVLAELQDGSYVLHRIYSLDEETGFVTLMGDGNLRAREVCSADDVKAVVTAVIKPVRRNSGTRRTGGSISPEEGGGRGSGLRSPGTRIIRPYSCAERFKAVLWRILLPFRRILLKLF